MSPEPPVLVLDADGRAGLACVQSLGRAGSVVHVGVRSVGSPTERSRWCRAVHAQPPSEPAERGLDWLLDLDRQFSFSLVLPATEAALRWLCRLPDTHPLHEKAVLPSNAALEAALDKEQTREIAVGLGIAVPASRLLPRGEAPPVAEGSFPKVLKPVRSKVVVGSRLMTLPVTVVRDGAERAEILAAWLPFTAVQEQEWVPGRGFGVEMLYDRGTMAWHFAHERLHESPLTGGASTWRRSCATDSELIEPSRRLLDRLGWHGVAMIEWRCSQGSAPQLIEINPRLWGSLPLTIAAGVDIPLGMLALARHTPLPAASAWRAGVRARNLTDDLQWFVDNARADKRDPLLLTQPVRREALGWLSALSARESWDGWCLRDPKVALGELADLVVGRTTSLGRRISHHVAVARARRRHGRLCGAKTSADRQVSSVLFVCLGNICRSPFAAEAARSRLGGIAVASGGFHADEGRPSPRHVVETARTLAIDMSACRSVRLTPERVAAADLILCMDVTNLRQLAIEYPSALSRATLLGLFRPQGPAQINDPFGLSPATTRMVFVQILDALQSLSEWIAIAPPV